MPSLGGQPLARQPSSRLVSSTTVVWSIVLPSSLNTILTTGASPATKCVPLAGLETERSTVYSGMLRGSLVVHSWESTTASTLPAGAWHFTHPVSLVAASWFTPARKSTSSWHEPQAVMDGTVFQLFTSAADPWW